MKSMSTVSLIAIYIISFGILTAADVASTFWATHGAGGEEFNPVVATDTGHLHLERLLALNGVVLLCTAGMLAWALGRLDRIDPRYLEKPERAMFNYLYFNPFSKKIMPKSIFHFLAVPPTILGMKALAAFNNSLIGLGVPDLISPLAYLSQSLVGRDWAYWPVIFVLFHLIWWPALHLTAGFVRSPRAPAGAPALA